MTELLPYIHISFIVSWSYCDWINQTEEESFYCVVLNNVLDTPHNPKHQATQSSNGSCMGQLTR
jgi:hypothetical protein